MGRPLIFVVVVQLAAALLHSAEPPPPPQIRPIDKGAAEKVSYAKQIKPLLEKRCADCHNPDDRQGGLDVTSLAFLLRGGKDHGASVIPGKPDESPLVQFVVGTKTPVMPKKAEPLSADEVHLMRSWIAAGAKDDRVAFPAEDVAFFEKSIRPLLAKHCLKCHAGADAESGLVLASRSGILAGGKRGPAAVPGKPAESLLLKAVRQEGALKMPKNAAPLASAEIAALEKWIQLGLPWPANTDVLAREKIFCVSDEDRNFWAFRTLPPLIAVPKIAEAKTAIDAFLLKELQARKIGFSPPADPYHLHRRLCIDLVGCQPTVKEMEAFQVAYKANPEKAFADEVDRLLALPEYGVRWGRHWLDLTHTGVLAANERRDSRFPMKQYEAWVGRAVGADVPYDVFVQAHIAGDLMPAKPNDPIHNVNDLATAAVVPLFGPLEFPFAPQQLFEIADKLDESIEFMGRTMLGLSLECARCHDHKFDPISQKDYYALLGIFRSSGIRAVPMTEPRPPGKAGDPKPVTRYVRAEGGIPAKSGKPLGKKPSSSPAAGDPFFGDVPLYVRGDVTVIGEVVPRRFPELFSGENQTPLGQLTKGSGRLELSRWLVAPDTPAASLVARTQANRIWKHLFGLGLVPTPDDLGMPGEQPLHPDLVDYLARRLIDLGWSQKKLIREVVLSQAYRQASRVNDSEADPENRRLAHQSIRRVDVETLISNLRSAAQKNARASASLSEESIETFKKLFDGAQPEALTPSRSSSVTAPQALFLMNATSAVTLAAEAVTDQAAGSGAERIAQAYRMVLSRPPTEKELHLAVAFLKEFPPGGAPPRGRGVEDASFTALVHALFSSDEFVYVQ